MTKINSFTQMDVWRKAHELSLQIYKITGRFPKQEMFGLVQQMRRAAVSITSNIAEGFGRRNKKEKQQFYYISKGSSMELQTQLLLAKDLTFISEEEFKLLENKLVDILKMLSKLILSIS